MESLVRVMFNSQIFCHQRFGGVSRYFTSLVRSMDAIEDVQPLVVAPLHFNDYLDSLPHHLVYGKKISWLEKAPGVAYAAGAIPGRIAGRRFKPAIVHNTYYFPERQVPRAALILTVYDMIHEKYPNYFRTGSLIARWKARCVAQADHVICISENTRRDVIEAYGIAESRTSVTHLACETFESHVGAETSASFKLRSFGTDTPYLLFVGSRAGHKNFVGLLGAYAASEWLRNNFLLVCFGGGEFTSAERAAISKAQLESRVKHVGGTGGTDAALGSCYLHAALFVYPSHYEGFGLPLLEAMSLGCPVACSAGGSFPEIAGDAARMFDSTSVESIRDVLESVLSSSSDIAALIERGRIRQRLFSWRKCAEQTVAVYRRVLADQPPDVRLRR
jgi:glycosyltransferase involved in cell wall biosynthesis